MNKIIVQNKPVVHTFAWVTIAAMIAISFVGIGVNDALAEHSVGSVSGRVWEDTNGNGLEEAGEPGIGGIVVNALDANDLSNDGSAVTAADGTYAISGLNEDLDYVMEWLHTGYAITLANVGADNTIDSDGEFFDSATARASEDEGTLSDNFPDASDIDLGLIALVCGDVVTSWSVPGLSLGIVHVGNSGNVYTADTTAGVHKWDADGNDIGWFGQQVLPLSNIIGIAEDVNRNITYLMRNNGGNGANVIFQVDQLGNLGTLVNGPALDGMTGMDIDYPDGNIYVGLGFNGIDVYNENRVLINHINTGTTYAGTPVVTPDNDVWVVGSGEIVKFDQDGNKLVTVIAQAFRMGGGSNGGVVYVNHLTDPDVITRLDGDGNVVASFSIPGTFLPWPDELVQEVVTTNDFIYAGSSTTDTVYKLVGGAACDGAPPPPPVSACTLDALADAGIDAADVDAGFLDTLDAACVADPNDVISIAIDDVIKGGLTPLAGEVYVIGDGATIKGGIQGDGSGTIILGEDVTVKGGVSAEAVQFTGIESAVSGGVTAGTFILNADADLSVSGGIDGVTTLFDVGANSVLTVNGEIICSGATVNQDPTAVLVVSGTISCGALVAYAWPEGGGGFNGLAIMLPLFALAALGLAIYVRPKKA